MLAELLLTDKDQKVQKLIEYFDLNLERNLDFDKNIRFNCPDQNYKEEKNLKELLDDIRQNGNEWGRISASCRRMIICDRELDLEKGLKILAESLPLFKRLLSLPDGHLSEPKKDAQNIVNSHKNQIYEIIRYVNTCGLISYRSGDYSKALNFFELADCIARNSNSYSSYFIPDTSSNRIRTEFEFVSQAFPGQIPEDSNEMYGKKLIFFIDSYKNEIKDGRKLNFEQEGEIENWIYGHGMASLYHNLAEAYSFLVNKGGNSSFLKVIFKEYAIRANEASLNEYGSKEKYEDIYRQLQSKNALRRLGRNVQQYENDLLGGKWERGKLMVYQDKIKTEQYIEDAQNRINEGVAKGYFKIEGSDKIGMLHNLNSIQVALKKKSKEEFNQTGSSGNESTLSGIAHPKIKIGGKEFTPLAIACSKIKIADELRDIFSYVLYKRQVINQIREDVSLVTNECIKHGDYRTALNFSEYYSNRSLSELSKVNLPNSSLFDRVKALKLEIQRKMESKDVQPEKCKVKTCGTSLFLGNETREDSLKLVLAYEDILKNVELNMKSESVTSPILESATISNNIIWFKNVVKPLVERLGELPEEENTAVIKFVAPEFSKDNSSSLKVFIIDKKGVNDDPISVSFTKEDYGEFISSVKKVLENIYGGGNHVFSEGKQQNVMKELANNLKIYEKIKGYSNIFIVPDGELFQIPLHLLGLEGQDLRLDYCVYYSPSLEYLVASNWNSEISQQEDNYLWVRSPTKDLFTVENKPCLCKPKVDKMTLLELMNGTLEEFEKVFEPNKYKYIGFSTHAAFQDNSATAYASLIRFYDSFLTTYDILLSKDFKGVENVFLGACSGASSKYTDENEAVGLVTSFLMKGAGSVIAPLCIISPYVHNEFIQTFNKNNVITPYNVWDLDSLLSAFKKSRHGEINIFIPFVQYTNLEIIEKKKCLTKSLAENEDIEIESLIDNKIIFEYYKKLKEGTLENYQVIKESDKYIKDIINTIPLSIDKEIRPEKMVEIWEDYLARTDNLPPLGVSDWLSSFVKIDGSVKFTVSIKTTIDFDLLKLVKVSSPLAFILSILKYVPDNDTKIAILTIFSTLTVIDMYGPSFKDALTYLIELIENEK